MERRLAGVSNNCFVYFSDSCIDVSFLFLEKSKTFGRSFNLFPSLPSLLSLPSLMERRLAGVSNKCFVYFSDSCIDGSFLFWGKYHTLPLRGMFFMSSNG